MRVDIDGPLKAEWMSDRAVLVTGGGGRDGGPGTIGWAVSRLFARHGARVAVRRSAAVARRVIAGGGYGDYFIHRTGHGIGLEEHEDPYMVAGNETPVAAGYAYSVEPGVYLPGRFGVRVEDIVVSTDDGPEALNTVDHSLVEVA